MIVFTASFPLWFIHFKRYPKKAKVKKGLWNGSGCGQVVSLLASYFDILSLNPTKVYKFYVKIFVEKKENEQKEARVGPFTKGLWT